MKRIKSLITLSFLLLSYSLLNAQTTGRRTVGFNDNWKFHLGESKGAASVQYDDSGWEAVDLPHDWSIFGPFSKDHPATPGGGALPGGKAWYRKTFTVGKQDHDKLIFIAFDGVYRNSSVWINGHFLGHRPNGYIAFRYELSRYLNFGGKNVIAVNVDNSQQPNSRWYSGSGIYRDVKLITMGKVGVSEWGSVIKISKLTPKRAEFTLGLDLFNSTGAYASARVESSVRDSSGKLVARVSTGLRIHGDSSLTQRFVILNPHLWSDVSPYMYHVETRVSVGGALQDTYITPLGLREFHFDRDSGLVLNGRVLRIRGVCLHHDLGALGAAFNRRAAERQLEILKAMGCNGIRTSHNAPAEEFLNLCDRMGFLVMDEVFDVWKKGKNKFDYSLDWDKWHKRDLIDQLKRDRNHPSVVVWSIGNEIQEQWGSGSDTSGRVIARELCRIARSVDSRPITSATNAIDTSNNIIRSGAYSLLGYNYNHDKFEAFKEMFPGKSLIATESVSALQTRGAYDMPSDSIRIWPKAWDKPLEDGNADLSCSAYDNCRTPWGATHEQNLRAFDTHKHVSGMFVWTGFDYLGEPTPYPWPARSSYFGIMDLAGFPKDVYYLYQSRWTDKPVLHLFPHWNWKPGELIDVWAYGSRADEIELFLNGKSCGIRPLTDSAYHVKWRVPFTPGKLRAVSRKSGKAILVRELETAGAPARIKLIADRNRIAANKEDLSFVTVRIEDEQGNLIPQAANLIQFSVAGGASIAGVDNGDPTSMESFKASQRKAFHGLALVILRAGAKRETVKLRAVSEGLQSAELTIKLE